MKTRYAEIDIVRAIAIVMMITFHTLFLLNYFDIYDVNVVNGFWWWFARVTAGTFIFVAGISLTISYSRSQTFRRFLLRGIKIFCWGLAITLVTWLVMRESYVIFGILHFIGVSIVLGYFFVRFRLVNLVLGAVLIAGGILLMRDSFSFSWLLPLGLMPQDFKTADYFPLLPWFGIFLIGICAGNTFYPGGKRSFNPWPSATRVTRPLTFMGKHSLLIYLGHQPVIIGILFATNYNVMRGYLPF